MDPDRVAEQLARLDLEEAPPPEGERRAAVAMILRFAKSGPEVLLMRRVEHPEDRWSGQISLPGGHADEEDEDLLSTAVREAHEEVGLDLGQAGRLLGRLPRVQAKARGRVLAMGITPFVFARIAEVEPVAGLEAQEVFWFPLLAAASGELSSTHRYVGRGLTLELPCWRYEGHVVWGLTHEMLSKLLLLAFPQAR